MKQIVAVAAAAVIGGVALLAGCGYLVLAYGPDLDAARFGF